MKVEVNIFNTFNVQNDTNTYMYQKAKLRSYLVSVSQILYSHLTAFQQGFLPICVSHDP